MTKIKCFTAIITTLFLWPLTGSASAEDLSDVQVVDGKARLVPMSIIGPEVAEQRKNIEVTVVVENQGDTPSGSYNVSLYLTKDKIVSPAGNDRLLGQRFYKEGVEPGKSKEATLTVVIPNSGLDGNYYYGARVEHFSVEHTDVVSINKVKLARFGNDDDGLTVTDHETGLTWQQSDDGKPRLWQQAGEYCSGLDIGGYKNWRLPNRKELMGIWGTVKHAKRGSIILAPIFSCKPNLYWTSNSKDDDPKTTQAWLVYFVATNFNGPQRLGRKDWGNLVRCVRSRP